MADNFVSVTGNLTRDVETGETAGGATYARLGVAVNRRWKKKGEDDWSEQVSFLNVTAWGDLADNVASSLEKGNRVVITGRLEQQTWEKDGEKKSAVQIVADSISPDLRWATAEVTRLKGTGGGSSAGRDDLAPIDEEPF